MPILKDNVQILRVHELSNSSQIVVALGRRLGQFRVMAKGSRRWPKKGFEGGFDLLLRGELLAYPRPDEQLWVFKEWEELARPELGQSYRMLAAGSFLCELCEALTRHTSGAVSEPADVQSGDTRLYDLLESAAETLSSRAAEPALILVNFTLNALACEGVLLDLERCRNCATPFFGTQKKIPRVWMMYDGLECEACLRLLQVEAGQRRGFWLQPEAHRALLYMRRSLKPLKLSPSARAQVANALASLVHGAIERDLRTLPYAMTIVRQMGAENH